MYVQSENPFRHIPRLAAQTLFLLLFHFLLDGEKYLYPLMPLLALTALGLAWLPPFKKLKLPWALAGGIILPWLIRPLVGAILILTSRIPGADGFTLIEWESFFFIYMIPWTLLLVTDIAVLRNPGAAPWEIPLYGLILMVFTRFRDHFDAVMTPQEYFFRSFVVALMLVILQLLVLLLFRGRARPDRKKGKGSFLIPLLLFIPLLILLLSLASSGSLSAGGGLMQSGLFRFDFSDYLKLESKISMSDDLVLLFRKEGPSEKIYLRRYILSGYSPKKGFYRDEKRDPESRQVSVPRKPLTLPQPKKGTTTREEVKQDYFLITLSSDTLLGMNNPERIVPYINWPDSSFKGVYTVTSRVSQAAIYDLVFAGADTLDDKERSFFTEYGGNEAIRNLALEVTAGTDNYYTRVATIESWLKDNFLYSLKPGTASDGNQLEYFLFDARKGYCSYFAFAMTLMCRSIGIPARVVVGFFVHPDSGVLNFYPVQANQAHAWVEVWFDEYGWIEFDPTSQTMAPGEDFEFGMASPEDFIPLIEEILNNQNLLAEMQGKEDSNPARLFWTRFMQPLIRQGIRLWFLIPLLWLGLVVLSRYRFHLSAAKTPGLRYRAAFYAWMDRLHRAGLGRPRNRTLSDHADRLGSERGIPLKPAADKYLKAVFSPSFGDNDLESGMAALEKVRNGYRTLPPGRRLLAFFYPLPRFRRFL
jgi:transglutaminase-like putative cysteine protease